MTNCKIGKIDVINTKLGPISQEIIKDLRLGLISKKEIANKYKVDLATVHRLAQAHNTGIKEKVDIIIVNKGDETKMEHGGKRKRINDDTILEIVSRLENGKSAKEVSKELSVSLQSVYKYAKEFDVEIQSNRKKKVTTKESTKSVDQNDIVEVKEDKNNTEEVNIPIIPIGLLITKNTVTAGLIKDRHNLPVDKYIFDDIDSRLMFDYNKLDKIVKDFIEKEQISGNTNLVVYVTGLVSANASLIKVCSELNINLTLMHYNEDSNIYHQQPIFTSNKYHKFNSYFSDSTFIGLYECDEKVANSGEDFWIIKIIDFNSNDKNNRNIETIIFDNKEKLWREFSKVINIIMTEKNTRKTVFVDRCNWDKTTNEIKHFNVSQTCNFR